MVLCQRKYKCDTKDFLFGSWFYYKRSYDYSKDIGSYLISLVKTNQMKIGMHILLHSL